jgi:hypothetical protein
MTCALFRAKAIALVSSRSRDSLIAENNQWLKAQEEHGIAAAFALVNGDERVQLWERILVAYGTLHQSNNDLFVWTLLAYLAGHLAMLPAVAGFWQSARGTAADEMLEEKELVTAFFLGNFGIFDDLVWVHLLFLEQGIDGIERAKADVPQYLLSAFRIIELGRATNNRQLIEEGNALLVDQEQIITLTPIFDRFPRGLAFWGSLGLQFPQEFHRSARQLGINHCWPDTNPSYGPVLPRLVFLRVDCFQAFVHWLATQPERAKKLLSQRVDAQARFSRTSKL